MTNIFKKKKENTSDDLISLSHIKWNCKQYIVFTPKYRRRIFYGEKRIEEYMKNQLKEDMMYDQISIKKYLDSFKDKNKQYGYQKHISTRQDGYVP